MFNYKTLLPHIKAIAEQAGDIIMQIYQNPSKQPVHYKADNTPVTQADLLSHRHIHRALKMLTPDIPIVSEEDCPNAVATHQSWPYYWLVDPLDGTKEFIARNDEFVVNIAFIAHQQPVLGVMHAPVTKTTYFAHENSPAYKQIATLAPVQIHCHQNKRDHLTIVTSRHGNISQMNALANALGHTQVVRHGSTIKLCLLAEGLADIYTRFSPILEWDLAAGQCILEQAGGKVCALDGSKLRYNNPSFKLKHFFAVGYPAGSFSAQTIQPILKRFG